MLKARGSRKTRENNALVLLTKLTNFCPVLWDQSFGIAAWGESPAYLVKFIYSEKATKFCEIFTLLLNGTTYLGQKKVKISKNFVAFSEYMNFKFKSYHY